MSSLIQSILSRSITYNQIKNPFKFQAARQENRKDTKGLIVFATQYTGGAQGKSDKTIKNAVNCIATEKLRGFLILSLLDSSFFSPTAETQ